MDTLSLIFHLLNFLAPAVFMAAWLWVFSPNFVVPQTRYVQTLAAICFEQCSRRGR